MSEDRFVRLAGRQVVYVLYATVVAIAGLMGFVLGTIEPDGLNPVLFGVIDLPPTPVGMAIFGVTTVSVGLGTLLIAVSVVGDRFDENAR